jgi:hypothetical protein
MSIKHIGIALMAVILAACGRSNPAEPGAGFSLPMEASKLSTLSQPGHMDIVSTPTPYATYTLYPTYTPMPTNTAVPTSQPDTTLTIEPTSTLVINGEESGLFVEPDPTVTVAPVKSETSPDISVDVALQRNPDSDPAPPLSVSVDRVAVTDDGGTYRVTGQVRNVGDRIYDGINVVGTFFDDRGLRFGPVDSVCGCFALAPGASCGFSLEIYARDYVSYGLHPEGHPKGLSDAQPVTLEVKDIRVTQDRMGRTWATGRIFNRYAQPVNQVRVSGEFLDEAGGVLGLESTTLGGAVVPDGELSFELLVDVDSYAHYRFSAEGRLQ